MPGNKKIFINLLPGIFVLFTQVMLSQDSIFFRATIPVKAKVIEVNNTEIKYYRDGNTTGPLYVVSKNSVACIKYADNYIDSFSVVIINRKIYPKLILKHTTVYCNNKEVSTAELLALLEEVEDTIIQNKLIDQFNAMRKYRSKHFTNGVFGSIALAGGLFYGFIGYSLRAPEFGLGAAVAGVVVFTPAMILSSVNKKKYLMELKLLVNNYNQLK